jgi:preprotein translocase subunit SecF
VSVLGDLYHGRNRFDFSRAWRISLPLAVATTVLAVVLLLTRGLELSVDFEGGGVWEVPVDPGLTVADARQALAGVELAEARIQLMRDPDGRTWLRVQAGTEAVERQADITERMADLGDTTVDQVAVNTVGPTWGDEITNQALRALVFFFIAVSLYLAWRLEWRMAAGALAAVVHDLTLTAGVFALFGFQVTPATVIALLTILGYSLYDTVVVFDKVLAAQSDPNAPGSRSYRQMVSDATNQVFMRSVNTTVTTLLPVLSMLFIGSFLLGGATLRDFSLALLVGLLAGAYSSIFVSAPLLVALHERNARRPTAEGGRRRPEPHRERAAPTGGVAHGSPGRSDAGPARVPTTRRGTGVKPAKRRRG